MIFRGLVAVRDAANVSHSRTARMNAVETDRGLPPFCHEGIA